MSIDDYNDPDYGFLAHYEGPALGETLKEANRIEERVIWRLEGLEAEYGIEFSYSRCLDDEEFHRGGAILEAAGNAAEAIGHAATAMVTSMPVPPSVADLYDCEPIFATEVFTAAGDALRSHAPIEALRAVALEHGPGSSDEEVALLNWVNATADHLAEVLPALPPKLRRVALVGMARRLDHHRAAVAIRAQMAARPPLVIATPWRPSRSMVCNARPPPTPERCRPAVMLTGPPAPCRRRGARTNA